MRAQTNPKAFAYAKVLDQWGSKHEYNCLVQIWERESHWNPLAHNKRSGAFGIAQFMPETWGNYKLPYKPKSASVQITGGLRYIYKRYGSPCQAWAWWQRHNWY
jgi:membrane-bound lytic murein transglycosylase MltF